MRKRFRGMRRASRFFGCLCVACAACAAWSLEEPAAWAAPASKAPLADQAGVTVYEPGNRRDPFTPLVRDGKIISPSSSGPANPNSVGPLVLDGILWDPKGQSIALVNGTEVKKGDHLGGYVVRDIRQDAVVLEQGNETLVLQINFEATPAPDKGEGS